MKFDLGDAPLLVDLAHCHTRTKIPWIPKLLINLALFCLAGCITGGDGQDGGPEFSTSVPKPPSLHWTTLGPEGALILRTFAAGPSCPEVLIGGQRHAMASRAEPTSAFPVRVCEKTLGGEAHDVRFGQERVALVRPNINKILILGDTGCRLKKTPAGVTFQSCRDPKAWPFAAIAQAAVGENPDLVIHVGDYHYREAACSKGQEGCKDTPYGDNWSAWLADFFAPAAPLLPRAPWIFVRGNHELCSRAGHGWGYFLDPRPFTPTCTDHTPPYTLALGDHLVAVIDSADDQHAGPSLAQIYPQKGHHLWILTHRPFLTPPPPGETPDARVELPPGLRGLGKVSAVFTGHRHMMSLNQFRDARPPELILGNSGTTLDSPILDQRPDSASEKTYSKTAYDGFGYLTMEKAGANAWVLVEHDRDGKPVIRCVLKESEGHKTTLNCDTQAYEGL